MRRIIILLVWCIFLPALQAQPKDNVIRSAQSGLWSESSTWVSGKVPGTGAKVLIREGHRVEYDADSKDVIRGITISGTLAFSQKKDTRLEVGLIGIVAGDEYSEEGFSCEAHIDQPDAKKPLPALEIGMPNHPLPAQHTALIRLHYQAGMNKDSCPAIICCAGRMDLHGAPLNRTWLRLGTSAKAGDPQVSLEEGVTGWKKGDRVVLTGTNVHGLKPHSTSEERIIQAVEGTKVTFDQPLKFDHLGDGNFRGEVANLSRNVVVESADPEGCEPIPCTTASRLGR